MMKRPSVQSFILFAAVHTLAESNGFIRANWWAGCRRHPRISPFLPLCSWWWYQT
jgi:hypothetical protein